MVSVQALPPHIARSVAQLGSMVLKDKRRARAIQCPASHPVPCRCTDARWLGHVPEAGLCAWQLCTAAIPMVLAAQVHASRV